MWYYPGIAAMQSVRESSLNCILETSSFELNANEQEKIFDLGYSGGVSAEQKGDFWSRKKETSN
jgi:hypothetical protein